MGYGVKANVDSSHRFLRAGSLCWIYLTNPGGGGDRVAVSGMSRSGRRVDTWVNSVSLRNFRVGFIPPGTLAYEFEDRDAARIWAALMESRFSAIRARRRELADSPRESGPGRA